MESMDGSTLVAAIIASLLTAVVVRGWAGLLGESSPRATKDSSAIQKARTNNYINLSSFTFVGVSIAFVWVWIAGFHWSTVVAFGWPYAAGYAWGHVGLKRAFERSVRTPLIFSLLITFFA